MSLTFLACFLSAFFQFSFFVVQAILHDIDSLFHLNQNMTMDILLSHLNFVMSNCHRSNFTWKIHKESQILNQLQKNKASIALKITCYKHWHLRRKKDCIFRRISLNIFVVAKIHLDILHTGSIFLFLQTSFSIKGSFPQLLKKPGISH